MAERRPLLLSWSGGKDSSLALETLRHSDAWSVAGLLTTVTEDYDRISMHGVRRALLEDQAAAVGLPLTIVTIPRGASGATYEERMEVALDEVRRRGIGDVAFGDLFLEDVRRYREERLASVGMGAVFPLWDQPTAALAEHFIEAGFRAILTCVDTTQIPASLAGREFDPSLLADLPPAADPCGENGEFHTFVYGGPPFARTVPCVRGEVHLRDERFMYCDLE